MRLFSKQRAELEIREEADAIRFDVSYDTRRNKRIAGLFLAAISLWQVRSWLHGGQLDSLIFALIAALMCVRFLVDSRFYRATLVVMEYEVRFEYFIGEGKAHDRILASAITELVFGPGNGSPHSIRYNFGLYAERGRFHQTLILPLLDEEDVSRVRNCILERFPLYSRRDPADRAFTLLGLNT